jgi:ferredoxin
MTDDSGGGTRLEVTLDGTKCQGYGLCLGIAPEVFDIPGGSPVAILIRTTASEDERAQLEEAVRSCPAQAISVTTLP